MKIVYFGSSEFSKWVLPYLKDFEVELIVDENTPLEKVFQTKAEVAVLAAYGKILPKKVLEHFNSGILNIHPSLLPKYRGPSPVQTAILNGDKKTGVTVIRLDEEMDHGPILGQEEIEISKNDTAQTLYEKLFPLGAKIIAKNLDKYVKSEVKLTWQSHEGATYTKILKREDGFVNLSEVGNQQSVIERKIRAYYPWPGVWGKFRIQNSESKIIKFLPGKRIQVEGKKAVNYKDFINGYPDIDKRLLELLKWRIDK